MEETKKVNPYLINTKLATGLETMGILYFVLNIIGSIVLIISAFGEDYKGFHYVNYEYIIYGIAFFFSSLIIMLICLGISRIIEQNIYLINNNHGLQKT